MTVQERLNEWLLPGELWECEDEIREELGAENLLDAIEKWIGTEKLQEILQGICTEYEVGQGEI